ncbi:MAG: sugar phosphate isomerase/epimerase family protein [Oenococcus sp.]|uniref:sugar phosphate isomerase/epimerase family protein n=1 Tax=Oenococcus TaxID=46254 RepID=UPI0021E936A9|nr:sugar phosphate isomerase/epimerase family protein [Oenococcus kitaharae]MCV3296612.1 sugar phosphate isomerase/epimerase [Oenococcus kitaharae]
MIQLGFLSAIFPDLTFEEVVDFAEKNHFQKIELASWPEEKATRKYAGVSHLNVDKVIADDGYASYIKKYLSDHGVSLSALGYYPNVMDQDLDRRSFVITHLKKVIQSAHILGLDLVNTFIGRKQNTNLEDNYKLVAKIWPDILQYAEDLHVRIGIENCPMLFTNDEWPGGQNIFYSPQTWREIFKILPTKNLGINFDPSHMVWQKMDYIAPIYEFSDKLFQIHFKDIKVLENKLSDVGILATPLQFMVPKLPGLGDVDFGKFVSALTDVGYDGTGAVEMEDAAFDKSLAVRKAGMLQSAHYLSQYLF